jgi:phage terminase small subunit
MSELNEMQKRFCQEYLISLNATQAAKKAGYSEKTARSQGNRLLTNVDIQEYIQKLQEGVAKRNQIAQDEIIRDLIEIKNRCMQNVPVMYFDRVAKEWKHEGAEYGEPLYKFDSQGATKALDLLGKITGAYEKDNQQKGGYIVNINRKSVKVERD